MKTTKIIGTTLLLMTLINAEVWSQNINTITANPNVNVNVIDFQKQPNIYGGPNGIGGPNLMGVPNININVIDNNLFNNDININNGTLSNVAINTNIKPVVSNINASNASKPVAPKPVALKPVAPKPQIATTTPVSRSITPQVNASRSATPVSRSTPQRSVPISQASIRNITPSNQSVAQRTVPAPKPVAVTTPKPKPAVVSAPKPIIQTPITIAPKNVEVPIESTVANLSNEVIEMPVQQYRGNFQNNVILENENNTTPNKSIEIPQIELPKITFTPNVKTEEEVSTPSRENDVVSSSNKITFSRPSKTINMKSSAIQKTKISAPKKGNKSFYTQKYASKISLRKRLTQTKKAFKSMVKSKTKKKIKIAPKVCYAF
jgi:hypothetical protein